MKVIFGPRFDSTAPKRICSVGRYCEPRSNAQVVPVPEPEPAKSGSTLAGAKSMRTYFAETPKPRLGRNLKPSDTAGESS